MKLNAAIIVKDDSELSKLHKAVYSIASYVDGVYITANGKDVDGIKEYCEKNNLHYSYLKWSEDFSAQRNFNFAQAPQDSDYIFWMDSDDILVGGDKLQEVARQAKETNKDVVFFTYWYGCRFNGEPSINTLQDVEMEHMRERLIRPGTHRWVGRLHETPVPVSGARNNYTKYPYDKEHPMAIMHTASLDKAEKNMERNKRILELQLKEEREKGEADPRTLLYLIKIYAEEEDKAQWDKVIKYGEEYIKKSGWDEERGTCYEQMSIVAAKQGDFKQTVEYLHSAIREWPHQPLFHIRLATAYYNLKQYRAAKQWMDFASTMDLDNKGSNLTNFKAMKVMFAELLVKLSYNVEKDVKKTMGAAKLLYSEMPTKQNREQVLFMEDLNDLNEACHNVHLVAKYLDSIGEGKAIIKMLDSLPVAISDQPFGINIRKHFSTPRRWEENEICYFANFGQPHFEKWGGDSLDSGIGGSETAVVELSRQWAKKGYRVTVYGDPKQKGVIDGVNYLPYFYFNKNDSFNIFIQWRGWQLAGAVKCKKFYVDLHDVFSSIDIKNEALDNIDGFFVKSKYHRELGLSIPDEKMLVVSNGIQV